MTHGLAGGRQTRNIGYMVMFAGYINLQIGRNICHVSGGAERNFTVGCILTQIPIIIGFHAQPYLAVGVCFSIYIIYGITLLKGISPLGVCGKVYFIRAVLVNFLAGSC